MVIEVTKNMRDPEYTYSPDMNSRIIKEQTNRIKPILTQLLLFCNVDEIPDLKDVFEACVGPFVYTVDADDNEPKTVKEAMDGPEAEEWDKGIREELQSLKDLGVYKLVPPSELPKGRKVLQNHFVFKCKKNEFGDVVRWKIRLVVRGFEQVYGRDFTSTKSPTARMESLRIILHLAAANNWEIQQIDDKTAYPYGLLPQDDKQYMYQPEGYEEKGKEDWIWELQKGLYGMKQSGRIWNRTMHEAMVGWGFQWLPSEHCIYVRTTDKALSSRQWTLSISS